MSDNKSSSKPAPLETVFAVRKFTLKSGRSAMMGQEVKGSESYCKYLVGSGLASSKKPSKK